MKNKKVIKTLMIISVLIIILIIVLLIFLKNKPSQTITEDNKSIDINSENKEVYMTSEYFEIKNILETFNSNCKRLNTKKEDLQLGKILSKVDNPDEYIKNAITDQENLAKEIVYGYLDEEYIETANISKENIKNEFAINYNFEILIEDISKENIDNNSLVEQYNVKGKNIDTIENKIENFNTIIFIDSQTNTFSMYPLKSNQNIDFKVKNNVKNTGYNLLKRIDKVEDNMIAKEYFYNYKNIMIYDTENAYRMLDEDYAKNKFENIENYKKYVQENIEELKKLIISKYKVNRKGTLGEYECLDQNGKYYIFKVTGSKNYTVFLDTYTANLPEFTEKYEKANDQQKVALNINKVISAINNQDYRYVYSKLADSFKNSSFNNEDSLKEFLQNNIYNKNEIEFDDFEREGNLYIYKVRIVKKYEEGEELPEGKNAPYRKFNIVMQLKEDSDFIMSFSIDE